MEKLNNYANFKESSEKDLKQNYIENLKDNKFKELIKTLPATEDILMKYTSKLKDSSIELDNCMNCKGLKYCKNHIQGYIYTPTVMENIINFEYKMCHYQEKIYHDEKYQQNIELFQISENLKKASFKDLYTDDAKRLEIIKYFKNFLDNHKKGKTDKGLYLHGNFGTGKTYMIASLFNEMAKRGVRSAIVYYPEFLRSLKESFDIDYKEKFNYIKKVELLLLDDIGAEVVSSWGRDEILSSILQYRMEENLPTFLTSNLNIEELEEHLSMSNKGVEKVKARRIIERIKYMCIDIELISINRRK